MERSTNLDKLSESRRNKAILVKAREAILKYFPDSFRETTPIVRREIARMGRNKGRVYYFVLYPFQETEGFDYSISPEGVLVTTAPFAARVSIWADTGKVVVIESETGDGVDLEIPRSTPD